ncbi:hypothetical protein ACCO45_007826 [Purpureocillium lilacinum]|uniref:Uncharacterized protein n=1 Tax=Purpureocillium lilacinum TaxID=33203 RepID=A0ACC4DPN0_PURLI
MTATTTYALDRPISETGGPEHVRQALAGSAVEPANYSFHADDGTRLVYHVTGHGPELVLGTSPGWGPGINYIVSGFAPLSTSGRATLVVLQTRGTLPSAHPADETRMGSRHMAADLDALRRHLLVDKPVTVLGHSNGGAIALAYAADFPSHCARAVLLGAQAVLPLYFHEPAPGVAQFARDTGPLVVQNWANAKQRAADAQPEAVVIADLGRVTADVLIVSGSDDFICSVDASAQAKEAIGAKAKHVVYEECGHMAWIEKKDEFFKELLAFLP